MPDHSSPGNTSFSPLALSRRVSGLNDSLILEIAARAMASPDSIQLHAGESDEPTPAFIVNAAIEALQRGETRYTLSRGIAPLRTAIADYLARTYQCDMGAERITVTVGGMQAIAQSLLAITEPGDEVVIPVPVWPNILETTRIAGAVPVTVAMAFDRQTGWMLDLHAVEAALTPRTKVIFINSPGNPTGAVLPGSVLSTLLAWSRERGIWIVSDEVYGRLIYGTGRGADSIAPRVAPSMLPLINDQDRVLVTNTMSKNWSMTGWRVGWVVAPTAMGQTFDNLMQYGSTGTATFAQHAAVVALNKGDDHITHMVRQCEAARDIVCHALTGIPGMRFTPPDGAFYLFFSPGGVTDSRQFAIDLFDATGVSLSPGAAFHNSGEGWMRLCFGVSHEALREAGSRIRSYLLR